MLNRAYILNSQERPGPSIGDLGGSVFLRNRVKSNSASEHTAVLIDDRQPSRRGWGRRFVAPEQFDQILRGSHVPAGVFDHLGDDQIGVPGREIVLFQLPEGDPRVRRPSLRLVAGISG